MILEQIQKENYHFSKQMSALFKGGDAPQNNAVTWAVLSDLCLQGKIEFKKVIKPGVKEGLYRTGFEYPLKNK